MKLIISGDFCPKGRVTSLFEEKEFASVIGQIKDIIAEGDYSVVNFECPIDTKDAEPIEKCGPNLKCSEGGAEAIKYAGFNCVTLANNHFLDYGEEGVKESLDTFNALGIDCVGGGKNIKDAAMPLYKKINGKNLAIINCCEHEFCIATEASAGSNPLNPIQQYYSIKEAHEKADYVLVIVHGGPEHYNLPTPRMVETYRFFIDAGADAVVNHHQHCYSGYEEYKDKPIFYGLGNFCFDKLHNGLSEAWHEGYMVELFFGYDGHVRYKLIPYFQCKKRPSVELMKGEDYNNFFDDIKLLNAIIANPEELKRRHEEWMEATGSGFEHQFLPYSNRWLLSAYIRHLFPSFLSKRKLLNLQNHLECESHRERSLFALNKLLKKQ